MVSVSIGQLCQMARNFNTKVSSFHVTALFLFASVYEKPSTCPVLRPKSPWRLGPTLLPSSAFRLWHCAHRVYTANQARSRTLVADGAYLEEVGTLFVVTYTACQ